MEPTIDAGDRVAANTRYARLRTGDVIVFKPPSVALGPAGVSFMIKRVIGLPGQTVASSGDTVLINGRPLAEPYLRSGQSLGPAIGPEVIPAGQYFVLGDNRTNSADSRYFGPIDGTSVIGVVTAIQSRPDRGADERLLRRHGLTFRGRRSASPAVSPCHFRHPVDVQGIGEIRLRATRPSRRAFALR
jgi:signal peptidase I